MSNIFDLFGAVNNTPTHQCKRGTTESMINPLKSRIFTDNKNVTLKNSVASVGSKPKGLSIRPQSDPNICNTNSNQKNDKITSSKLKLKPIGTNSNTLLNTPHNNKEKMAKGIREKQRKGLSPVSKSPHATVSTPKQIGEFQFKIPKIPYPINKNIIVYPEPEKLSNYCDQEESDRISLEKIYFDEDFNNFIPSRKNIPLSDDEGFISEPELLNVPPLSPVKMVHATCDSDDAISMEAPEIPIVSDDDDDNF